MAQSPETANAPANALERYLLNWAALGQLIDEGRSFSGYERNCAFLNLRGSGFATVSAATGLDLLEDSRALATCDWDFDGKQDFWMTNRTGPKIRLLMNESSSSRKNANFVGLRLRGTVSNRDAIGARVELYLNDASQPLLRSVHAGDGFLAQSSRWLHFGLGTRSAVGQVVVRWPGAAAETFDGISPGKFFDLVEGTGDARIWQPPEFKAGDAGAVVSNTNENTRRTWIIGRVPFPKAHFSSWEGIRIPVRSLRGKPVLINLWESSCLPCLKELQDWNAVAEDLKGSGLQVVALAVDGLDSREESDVQKAHKLATSTLSLNFNTGVANTELVEAMEIVHRAFIGLKQPLPVPASFLLDKSGRVAAMYKGPVHSDTLIADVALLDKSISEQRDRAVPFSGRWAALPFSSDPLRIALTFSAAGMTTRAIGYLSEILEEPEAYLADSTEEAQRQILCDGYAMLGELHSDAGEPDRAAAAYAKLLTLSPGDARRHRLIGESLLQKNLAAPARAHLRLALMAQPEDASLLFNTGLAEAATGDTDKAIVHFKAALKRAPDDVATHFQLGSVLLSQEDTATAVEHFREALRIQPNWPVAAHQLAWILATCPDDVLRNGAEALMLAESVCQRDGGKNPISLHTWSAALAEVGRFEEALEISRRAIQIAEREPRYVRFLQILGAARDRYQERRPVRSQ